MATREEVDRTLGAYEPGPDDPALADLMRGHLEARRARAWNRPRRFRRPMATRGPGRGRISQMVEALCPPYQLAFAPFLTAYQHDSCLQL